MSFRPENAYPWVLFRLREEHYAVSARAVREMVVLDTVTALPGAPSSVRGVWNLRGRTLPLLDLRVLAGMPSSEAETTALIDLLTAREADHRRWLDELEACVEEQRAFSLATDPHECAFGKWYDHFTTDNLVLSAVLRRFDGPHRRIHAIATEVATLVATGAPERARALIERTRAGDLSKMVHLFASARRMLREESRETALVLESGGRDVAVSADAVVAVERLDDRFDPPPRTSGAEAGSRVEDEAEGAPGLIGAVGRRRKDQSLVLLLDPESLLGLARAHQPSGTN